MDDAIRNKQNRRDSNLEEILTILNNQLSDDEKELTGTIGKPEFPVIFIVGSARSGTTLIYQWLAGTGAFAYPSNIISRFYQAPYVGALIHKAFVDYDKFGELFGSSNIPFVSKLGKTQGAASPHEFWYFWHRFFRFGEIQKLTDEELRKVDETAFIRELAALEYAFGKPLVLKAMVLNWNLDYLSRIIPNSVFLHVKRDTISNMHSLYNAREEFFGDSEKWYSFKPPEYHILKHRGVYEQLAGQVIYTNQTICRQLENLGDRYVEVDYEDFCNDTELLYRKLSKAMSFMGITLSELSGVKTSFKPSKHIDNQDFDFTRAKKAIENIDLHG